MRRLRAAFRRRRRGFALRHLKFIDETGMNLALTRRYGRAAPGVRVVDRIGVNLKSSASEDRGGVLAE